MYGKVILLGIISCIGVFFSPAYSQSLEKAASEYKTFIRLNNESGDKVSMYAALYNCYKGYLAVIKSASKNDASYNQAKNAIRNIYPYLQNGAVFYSQKGDQQNALFFAQAYIDVPLMNVFRGDPFQKDSYYPTMVYFAASNTYNSGDYAKAVVYFKEYLSAGEEKNRKNVFIYMSKACINIKNYEMSKAVLDDAVNSYPSDFDLLSMAINNCIDRKDNSGLQKYVSKALILKPDDETLLNIQGKLYEDTFDYQKALNAYSFLLKKNPRSLVINKHIALNHYNLGVMNLNKAALQKEGETARKLNKQAKDYFTMAVPILQQILDTDPTSLKYTEALAVSYHCLGNTEQLNSINQKLLSLGGRAVSSSSVPSLIDFFGEHAAANSPLASASATTPAATMAASANNSAGDASIEAKGDEAPNYAQFAKKYVEDKIKVWQTKDFYETIEEYRARVTEGTRSQKIKDLLKEAEANYINMYTQNVDFTDMQLKPYDAENRAFLIESKFGQLIVPVPRENREAKIFESSWNGIQFKDPKFCINNGRLALAGLTFVTPVGNSYRYDNKEALNYAETKVDIHFDPIDNQMFAQTGQTSSDATKIKSQEIQIGSSDVDVNIPESGVNSDNTFAVIISNENYNMVAKVPMALNDGMTFNRYCEKVLGIPKNNIRFYPDASYGVMLRAMRDIKDIALAYSDNIKVVFYYAGHGIPNESTKDAFLLPVDADGTQTEGCYSLSKLYSELGGLNAKSVVVFLDACFSGAKRDGGMLASARGVALKVKKEDPKGNMVVFSAASGDETAFPYKEKGHGLFTYFLLKKLQESKGNVSLKDLGDYIIENVKQQSVVVNRKVQTPTILPSESICGHWEEMKLRQ
jgi:tetratricopeptide (TPR) repeat protein